MIGSLPSISMMLLAPALDHLRAVSQTTFWLVARSFEEAHHQRNTYVRGFSGS